MELEESGGDVVALHCFVCFVFSTLLPCFRAGSLSGTWQGDAARHRVPALATVVLRALVPQLWLRTLFLISDHEGCSVLLLRFAWYHVFVLCSYRVVSRVRSLSCRYLLVRAFDIAWSRLLLVLHER